MDYEIHATMRGQDHDDYEDELARLDLEQQIERLLKEADDEK